MTIDLKSIRPYRGSQQEAFEELVCQVVRRGEAASIGNWLRLDGAGGDGGVEAYWWPSETSGKIGLQAKYFTSTREIGWSQIEASFETGLVVHPDLREYRVYLACNLTGPTGRGNRSGTELWQSTKSRMEARAKQLGRDIAIELRTASDLLSELAKPCAAGLAALWFGAIELTTARLQRGLSDAITALGERYHGEDHVEVAAQDVMRALSRAPKIQSNLALLVGKLVDCDRIGVPQAWIDDAGRRAQIKSLNEGIDAIGAIAKQISVVNASSWLIEEWVRSVEAVETLAQALSSATWEGRAGDEKEDKGLGITRNDLNSIIRAARRLHELLEGDACRAEATRAALFVGPAGCGKSHCLAADMKELIDGGGVGVLLLGHRFHSGNLWPQIAAMLDAPGKTKDELLGALDAAALASRRRGVIVLDALNEGPMRTAWLRELESFIDDIRRYPSLAVAVSCRDVYEPLIVEPRVKQSVVRVAMRGFETDEEQEQAARVYLDRRGIARPGVPWIAPELVNPLFLRSVCTALSAKGIKEFPAGLIGTKQLLAWYLDACASNLDTEHQGSKALARCCKRTLLGMAKAMATARADWLEREAAAAIAAEGFAGLAAPQGLLWLDVLIRAGIVREDPAPRAFGSSTDPMQDLPDVVRLAFQRFQDHLMGEALLESVPKIAHAFKKKGALGFMVGPSGQLEWEWNGLIGALSIQVPEKYGVELVDVLPGGVARHWRDYTIEHAFVESVKWRAKECFTERTLELGNQLQSGAGDLLSILIALAPRPEHPWNAELLDRNFRRWPMPERDARWSRILSDAEDGHPMLRLIRWCETAPKARVDDRILRLSAICLAWSCTSSNRSLRDGATKALAALISELPALFRELLAHFVDVDDVYVIERVLAAGYGSLVRYTTPDKAAKFSTAVWKLMFVPDKVPLCLLARDYATGIVDIAEGMKVLVPEVDIERCRPPFGAKAPVLNVGRKQVEAIAGRAGDDQILRSCRSVFGDFGKYEIEPGIRPFTKVRLSDAAPLQPRDKAELFEREVITGRKDREEAISALKDILKHARILQFLDRMSEGEEFEFKIVDRSHTREWRARFEPAEKKLCVLLAAADVKRYRQDWLAYHLPKDGGDRAPTLPRHNPETASLWVARRAYALGWTKKRFGDERGYHSSRHSGDRATVERIGKKYQWIARAELMARLADNYWMHEEFGDGPRRYSRMTDIGYERDIDATIFDMGGSAEGFEAGARLGLMPAQIEVPDLVGAERLAWPFSGKAGKAALERTHITDANGKAWVRLRWYQSAEKRTQRHRRHWGHNYALQEYYFLNAALCRKGDARRIADLVAKTKQIDPHRWSGPEFTDGPYLYEIGKRGTWPIADWDEIDLAKTKVKVRHPVEAYHWERHLDAALPDGYRAEMLSAWLMIMGGVVLHERAHQIMRTTDGKMIAWSAQGLPENENSHGVVVDAAWLQSMLDAHGLEILWVLYGERNAWRDGETEGARNRRVFRGVKVGLAEKPHTRVWNEDVRHNTDDKDV